MSKLIPTHFTESTRTKTIVWKTNEMACKALQYKSNYILINKNQQIPSSNK